MLRRPTSSDATAWTGSWGRCARAWSSARLQADHPVGGPEIVPLRRTLLQEARKNRDFRGIALGLLAKRLLRPHFARRFDVECHPGIPNHKDLIWKVALLAGVRLLSPARSPRAHDRRVLLYWGGPTGLPPEAHHWPGPGWARSLNAGIGDTAKRNVARIFAQAFGYDLAVDPTKHTGQCVAKSNANSAHDGRLVNCPIAAAEPDLAFEMLIDNRVGTAEVLDLRVPVVGDELPFVYLKRRPIDVRFANRNSSVEVAATDDVFSAIEQKKIRAFCRAMALDLGELDILRDAATGRIFIVDVNRMPFGPPKPIAVRDGIHAVTLYAAAFSRLAGRWLESEAKIGDRGDLTPPPLPPPSPAG